MSGKAPSQKGKSKKKSQRSNAEANSQMVPYEDPEASSGRPQRPEQRLSNRNGAPQRSSRNHPPPMDDDVSDVSDAEYEANTAEEPQFKYSTAELNESGWRNGPCCIITMCVICIIVAIVLSIVMVKVTEKQDEDNTPSSAPTQTGTLPPPPPPPPGTDMFQRTKESVDLKCSEDNFKNDRQICEETCAGFACCDPSLAEQQSCLSINQEGCLNYSKCHVLNDDIEPAPDNLHEICSPEALSVDPSQCDDECKQLQCCWSDDFSCISSKFYACLDYAPCQNMRSDLKVVTADPTIYDFCSESAGSVSQGGACDDACAPAECCWSEDTDNCLQSDLFACLTYEPCDKLDLPPAGSAGSNVTAPPPTLDVEYLCSALYIDSDGEFDCQSACSKGSCCVEGAADNNCFLEDPLGCLPYDSCKNGS